MFVLSEASPIANCFNSEDISEARWKLQGLCHSNSSNRRLKSPMPLLIDEQEQGGINPLKLYYLQIDYNELCELNKQRLYRQHLHRCQKYEEA